MAFTNPYKQHNYMGEHATDAACLTFIQTVGWDSNGGASGGTPVEGMMFYDTTLDAMKVYANGEWAALSTSANIVDWQESVLDIATAVPGSPVDGDRNIVGPAASLAITGVNTGSKTFTVAGDQTTLFAASDKIKIVLSTGNNGVYTVVSDTFDTDHTDIVVSEVVPDATVDGSLQYADGVFSPIGIDQIVVYNGSSWDSVTPNEGFAAWVEDENVIYVFNGTSWVKMSAIFSHNDLLGLNSGDYQHLTSAQLSGLTGGTDTTLHTHDGRYFTESELGSTTASSEGASLIGTDTKTALNSATTVEVALTYLNSQDPAKRSSGATSPISAVSGAVGDLYVETTNDIVYINIDGTNTGWVVA